MRRWRRRRVATAARGGGGGPGSTATGWCSGVAHAHQMAQAVARRWRYDPPGGGCSVMLYLPARFS